MQHFEEPRRRFLHRVAAGFFTSVFATLPRTTEAKSLPFDRKGFVVMEGEGEHILTGRRKVPITIKISKEAHGEEGVSFCTESMDPGRKMRIHKHLYNEEFIFIHQGEGLFTLDEGIIEVKTGAVAFIPRGSWHGLENTGKGNLIMTFGYSPAGFEGYFRENGTPIGMPAKERTEEEYAITREKYGMVYK